MSQLVALDSLKAEILVFVQPTLAIKVTDRESQEKALTTGKLVKEFAKRVEARRRELVGPLNDQVKEINEYAKSITVPLDASEAHIKAQLRAHEIELERIRQEEIRKAEEVRKKAEAEAAAKLTAEREEAEGLAMFAAPKEAAQEIARVDAAEARVTKSIEKDHARAVKAAESNRVSGASRPWVHEVEDSNLVPREFLVVDEKKIREFIRAGGREIPGVKIFQDVRVSFR